MSRETGKSTQGSEGQSRRGGKGSEGVGGVLNEAQKKENEKIRELWRADKQIWEQNKKRGVKQAPHPRLKDLTLPPIPKPAILQSTSKSKSKASGSVQAQEESDSNITGSDDGSEEEATGDSGAE
ncbi:hypothetical protein MPER_12450 [Moniliophthora perniciosa FA553]|nr:hypothetical protein MPER_12450 [Moniliophthora perniciosa FA553]